MFENIVLSLLGISLGIIMICLSIVFSLFTFKIASETLEEIKENRRQVRLRNKERTNG